jgi:hypothetical protein
LLFGAIFSGLPASTTTGLNLGWLSAILGVGGIITMPILLFIVGLIQGLIYAAVYNFLAPRIGGIRLRFKEEQHPLTQA